MPGKETSSLGCFWLCYLNLPLTPSARGTAQCMGDPGKSRSTPALRGSTIYSGVCVCVSGGYTKRGLECRKVVEKRRFIVIGGYD